MEYFSIGAVVISLLTLVFTRIDKAKKDAKEDNQVLTNYRLDKIDDKLVKIDNKLDRQNDEIDEKIDKAIDNHIKIYHKNIRKGE
jgi:C-terminal processing protease CtpA/Prc